MRVARRYRHAFAAQVPPRPSENGHPDKRIHRQIGYLSARASETGQPAQARCGRMAVLVDGGDRAKHAQAVNVSATTHARVCFKSLHAMQH